MQGMRYEILGLTLQLATRFISTPCIAHYWYAAFFSLEDVPYANNSKETYKAIVRKPGRLTADEMASVTDQFNALIPHISFSHDHAGDYGLDLGCCRPRPYSADPLSAIVCGADIQLGSCYTKLVDAYDIAEDPSSDVEFLNESFIVAVAICHELAHAVQYARFDDLRIGFERQLMSEEGFDFEKSVFGGRVAARDDLLVLEPWPATSMFEEYMAADGGGMFVQPTPANGAGAEIEVMWRIPKSYVQRLFTQSFWDGLGPGDLTALQVPKLLGYREIPACPRKRCQCLSCWRGQKIAEILATSGNRESDPSMIGDLDEILAYDYPGLDPSDLSDVPCERKPFDTFPWGPWYSRAHGKAIGLDRRAGVPKGYEVLLDGTIVTSQHFEMLKEFERMEMPEDDAFFEWILEIVNEDDLEEDKKIALGVIREIVASKDLEGKRRLGGLVETILEKEVSWRSR